MNSFEKFSFQEIISAYEFDIKHYQRKREYHLQLAEVYQERITELHEKISKVNEEIKNERRC